MNRTRLCSTRLAIALITVTIIYAGTPLAAEIEELTVTKTGRTFIAEADFVIDAPYATVFEAFTAFDRLAELNPAVTASHSETQPDGITRVHTRLKDCVAFFCRSLVIIEDIQLAGGDHIAARIVPDGSDFKNGHTIWQFSDLGAQTRVRYRAEMTPDFWLPPLLGPHAVRKSLKRQIRATADNIEAR